MFGWRRKRGRHHAAKGDGRAAEPNREYVAGDLDDFEDADAKYGGPFDETEAPADEISRLDLGSVRLPVPDGAQLQVEVDPSGPVRAVHLVTPSGRLTVSAYAAPKTGGLWREIATELVAQLRADGAKVRRENGEWGEELSAVSDGVALRFVGVDGHRWMLRGVVAGPEESAEAAAEELRDLVRETVVVRGTNPHPVRTPLPVELPEAIARHIQSEQS